jgi:haloalkane dehalogenase
MHFVERGSGEQTILCVHGNPTWSFTYREVLKQLSDSARVIAVDHVGCGLSHKPQNYNYSIEQHIGNLARFIEQLDLRRVTLLLHDWGGAIGLGAALKLPLRIERLLLLNTAAFPPPYIPWRIAACRWPFVNSFGLRGMNLFARAAQRMTLNRLDALPPTVAAGLIAPYKDWDSRIAIAKFVQSIPTRKSDLVWQLLAKIEDGLSNLRTRPTRIVWGMKDWCFRPECLERLEKLLPQAKVRRLNDVGHYVMEEAATEVIEELRALLSDPPLA